MDADTHGNVLTNSVEHEPEDPVNAPVRPCEGNSAQAQRQIELQLRNLALEEQLLETQKRNLALEEKLLEWQGRILAQDERLLEMQKRTEILEDKCEDSDTKTEESKATLQDIPANRTSTNKHSNFLDRSTLTSSKDNKLSGESVHRIDRLCSAFIDTQDHTVAASVSLNEAIQYKTYCHATCEHKDRLWEASRIMRENEVHAFNNFAKLTESIRHSHTPDQAKYLKHRGDLHTLQNDLNRYRLWEEKFETLYQKHGCDTEGEGHTDEGYLFLRKRHDQGRKVIEDILGDARKLVGPPDLAAIVQQDHRAGVIIALGCNP
ncbi:hypothetical protein BG000_002327 [Podila horticola]|nr:hypothetical protein BG000_002327 [Podila horticola]